MTGILIFFHCPSNTGYAIGRHEYTFAEMARRLVGDDRSIHYAYPSIEAGPSRSLPAGIDRIIAFDPTSVADGDRRAIQRYVRAHDIRVAFGFDQPVRRRAYGWLREAGVRRLISYWGAPMSDLNHGVKLWLKRAEVALVRHKPDHFIFQSEDMRATAVGGRGIPAARTSVVRSGVDIQRFRPADGELGYAHDVLGIPRERRIVYYSGHMEPRKGVHVIVAAAAALVNGRGRRDVHFVFLGNRPGEETRFDPLYKGTAAEDCITFGGYRDDVSEIMPCCHLGAIGTTGWDSHTMSAVEMAACGLPVIVSDVPGLREAVSDESGLRFPPGDAEALADRIEFLLDHPDAAARMGHAARARVEAGYTREHQVEGLVRVVRAVAGAELGLAAGPHAQPCVEFDGRQ